MIKYEWIEVGGPDDYENIAKFISGEFLGGAVIPLLRKVLSGSVKRVLIEHPYIDKDYRSTYYAFYAKRARPFRPDCVRLHLFSDSATFDAVTLDLKLPQGSQGHYYGFIVLRPTRSQTIVRAVIEPAVLIRSESMFVMCAQHKVHLLGHRLTVSGFPWAQQASDIAVCAQTACWGVLRHYSERWPVYREFLLHEVTTLGLSGAVGGLRSERGLTHQEMERVLVAAGSYPLKVHQDVNNRARFQRELFAWLESGFPVVALLDKFGHAISLIGFSGSPLQPVPAPGELSHWAQVSGVIAMDDNRPPYWVAPLDKMKAPARPRGFSLDDVSTFFVPLPERVTYPSAKVDELAAEFAASPPDQFDEIFTKGSAVRYFVTTAAALRQFALKNVSAFPKELYQLYMRTELSQFVWIVELSSAVSAPLNHVDYRLVVDATAARHEQFPVFFAHSDRRALIIHEEDQRRLEWVDFSSVAPALSRMPGDLRAVGS